MNALDFSPVKGVTLVDWMLGADAEVGSFYRHGLIEDPEAGQWLERARVYSAALAQRHPA